jgi:site-specific recombinase XerD
VQPRHNVPLVQIATCTDLSASIPKLAVQRILCVWRGAPMTPKAFHALFGRIGTRANMPFPVHPHMLRHACGYALANAGHDTRALQAYLGHKNIQHTVRYTELSPHRFKNFWKV